MPSITIDNQSLQVAPGTTILDAAKQAGIAIPTLCYAEGLQPFTSCMMCVVTDLGSGRLLPACSTAVTDGMRIDASGADINRVRKNTLELLLSEHVGNCEGPCRMACPARADIPAMLSAIHQGDLSRASQLVRPDLVFPSIVERLCPAPCEMNCRRKAYDSQAVSIRRLCQHAADHELEQGIAPPERAESKNKKTAVIGAGPAGLAAAYHLALKGYDCTVFDDRDRPGGTLLDLVKMGKLTAAIVEAELKVFDVLDVTFRQKTRIGTDYSFAQLCEDFEAVILMTGKIQPEAVAPFGVELARYGIAVKEVVHQTSNPKVFAGGDAVRAMRLAAYAVRDGRAAACAADQFMQGAPVTGRSARFNSNIGCLQPGEVQAFMDGVDPAPRNDPGDHFTVETSGTAAARCLHCECLKPDTCRLRDYAEQFGASQHRFRHRVRHLVEKVLKYEDVVFEPGKCIRCGLCIRITEKAGFTPGLAFADRGIDVRVAVPFNQPLKEGLGSVAEECVESCPTAALAFRRRA